MSKKHQAKSEAPGPMDTVVPDGTIFRVSTETKRDKDAKHAHQHVLAFDLGGVTLGELAELATRKTSVVVDWQRQFRASFGGKHPKPNRFPHEGEISIKMRDFVDKVRAKRGRTDPMAKVASLIPRMSLDEKLAMLERLQREIEGAEPLIPEPFKVEESE